MDMDMYDDETVNFHTANGVTYQRQTWPTSSSTCLRNLFKAHVLDDTPSVLSMGKRCLDQIFTFLWPSGKDPFMSDKNGKGPLHVGQERDDDKDESQGPHSLCQP